uniref:NF-kappa-B inhibitor alpha n=1 Tax=Lepisosteus oculatus TaxID=7918 RepID=W5NA12_LEPOC
MFPNFFLTLELEEEAQAARPIPRLPWAGASLPHQTALHIAVIVNQPECVRGLLCVGASPDLQERSGNTALHIACREGLRECVRELVSHSLSRAPLHTTNYAGVTPLHIAVQKVDEGAVRLLLHAGADANRRDLSSGRTALHWAVESQSAALVRLLLSRGAAVDAPSYAGHTPLYCALHRPSEAVRSLLREGGAVEPLEEDEEEEDDEEEDDEEEVDELERKEVRENEEEWDTINSSNL